MPNWTPEQIATVASAIAALIGAIAAVVSAIFAGVAIRTQRRQSMPHVRVTHGTGFPVHGGVGRNLAGSTLGVPWFIITVHNDGLIPVTVRSVGLEMNDGGSAPFIRPPWPGADELPKIIAPGDEATFYLDELPRIAQVHAEHGGARGATAKLVGRRSFMESESRGRGWTGGSESDPRDPCRHSSRSRRKTRMAKSFGSSNPPAVEPTAADSW
jgi:hypothetical protein